MKIYQASDVLEAARWRVRYLFQEFPEVVVSFSGGKDSTVCLHLAIEAAKELNRLPVKVFFVDQEAEWQGAIDYIREVSEMPEVEMYWLQVPIRLSNGTSAKQEWLQCWAEGEKWMREKEADSIHENVFGTKSFIDMFPAILKHYFPDERVCYLAGVRGEESPTRLLGMTTASTYKHVTYGKRHGKNTGHYNFYPIYDWLYSDVWKYIHDNDFPYCRIYDGMFRVGHGVLDMRISNLHHETALKSLYIIQELEPKTWEALSERLRGINTFSHMGKKQLRCPDELPWMFSGWKEYRDYLLANLIEPEKQEIFQKKFLDMDKKYAGMHHIKDMYRSQISAIIVNDYHMTKIGNWERKIEVALWRRWKHQNIQPKSKSKYIHG